MASKPTAKLVVLGAITRPHGVRGEVRVHRFNDDSTLLLEAARVVVRKADDERVYEVRSRKRSGDADVLKLEGVDLVETAEALRGAEIGVYREELPKLPEDEHYHADLVGLAVLEQGVKLGEVISVETYPSVDVLRVRGDRGVLEIPILDAYVVGVDVAGGTIEVAHTDELELQ